MDQAIERKPVFKRWWFWAIIIILIGIGSSWAITVVNHKRDAEKLAAEQEKKALEEQKEAQKIKDIHEGRKPPMTAEELKKAESALASGISIDDSNNDFVKIPAGSIEGDGRPDNDKPYPLDFTSLKNVKIGADNTYFYVKYQYYGVLPVELQKYGDDYIASIMGNLVLEDFFNHNTGKKDNSGLLQLGLVWVQYNSDHSFDANSPILNPPVLSTSTFGEANSQVKDENGEDTYGIGTGAGKTFGGGGYDYMLAAFPLSNLGLHFGDTVRFTIGSESGSKIYHHQSIDPILDFGSAKSGKQVTWKIGANTYTSEIPKY